MPLIDPPPSLSPRDLAAIDAYTTALVAAAPPPTVELLARLRPLLAVPLDSRVRT